MVGSAGGKVGVERALMQGEGRPQVKSEITEGRGRGNMATWAALPGRVRQPGQSLSLSLADPIPTPLVVSQPGSPLPLLYRHTLLQRSCT